MKGGMAIEAFLMRHGETEANVQQVLLGREDSPFTEAGRRQPFEVARRLGETKLTCIYTSPMARSRRTAELVVEALGRPIELRTEPAIAEIDAGRFTGLTFEEVRQRVSEFGGFGGFRYPGGESWLDVQTRAVEFVANLEGRDGAGPILLVTHAGVIAGLVAHFLGKPIEKFIRTRFGHDFLGRLTVEGGSIAEYEKMAGTVDTWF